MADETNRFNVCLQAKRFKTATVKAKILDTDRLNHIGLDMSEWRCKDLAKIKYLKKSTTISLSNFCDVKKNGSDRQEAESPESASNSVSTKLSSQSGAQSNSKMFDSSGDFPNNNKPRNNASSGLACSTCQPSGDLIENYSHIIVFNKSPKLNRNHTKQQLSMRKKKRNLPQSNLIYLALSSLELDCKEETKMKLHLLLLKKINQIQIILVIFLPVSTGIIILNR